MQDPDWEPPEVDESTMETISDLTLLRYHFRIGWDEALNQISAVEYSYLVSTARELARSNTDTGGRHAKRDPAHGSPDTNIPPGLEARALDLGT